MALNLDGVVLAYGEHYDVGFRNGRAVDLIAVVVGDGDEEVRGVDAVGARQLDLVGVEFDAELAEVHAAGGIVAVEVIIGVVVTPRGQKCCDSNGSPRPYIFFHLHVDLVVKSDVVDIEAGTGKAAVRRIAEAGTVKIVGIDLQTFLIAA